MTKRFNAKMGKEKSGGDGSRAPAAILWLVVGLIAVALASTFYRPCGKEGCTTHASEQRSELLGFIVQQPSDNVHHAEVSETAEQQNQPRSGKDIMATIKGSDRIFVTFGNAAYWDMIHNWVLAVERIGIPHIVAVLDDETERLCREAGVAYWAPKVFESSNSSSSVNFRAQFKLFRSMGAKKVGVVLALLEQFNVGTVTVSDADVVWLKDPTQYYAQHPTADWFLSTDCLSVKLEEAWQPVHLQPRCGHIPGNHWGRAFNSGMFAVRNTPMGKLLLHHWMAFLQDSGRESVTNAAGDKIFHVTDQLALNLIFDQAVRFETGQFRAAPEDSKVILVNANNITTSYSNEAGSTPLSYIRIRPLPVLEFSNGHVTFIQRTPMKRNIVPYAVHATYQNGYTGFQIQHKRERFREMHMWMLDSDQYYEGRLPEDGWFGKAADGKFLVYDNNVVEAIMHIDSERLVHDKDMPSLYKHWIAGSYQLAVLRDAMALSRMLERIIILPTLWSWCDLDYTPDIIMECVIRGSDQELPFQCPSDHLLQIPLIISQRVPFRTANFLQHPRIPDSVRESYEQITVAKKTAESGAELWPGITESEVKTVLSRHQDTRVLHIKNLSPGLIGSFAKAQANEAFDALFKGITVDLEWCCATTHLNRTRRSFPYVLPAKLTEKWKPWTPPKMAKPTYCDDPAWDADSRRLLNSTNHPCKFFSLI